MKKTIAAIVTGAILGAAPLTTAEAAPAQDGCFSYKEWYNAERGTKQEMERYAGVVGMGTIVIYNDQGDHIVREYPTCGGNPAVTVQVDYRRNKAGQYMANNIIWLDMR